MFTGIIECTGEVTEVIQNATNLDFWIQSPISHELHVDQSVSHDGVCLTVTEVKEKKHKVTAVLETLNRTTLADWRRGYKVNIERCLKADGRFDGHIVQGHVDCRAELKKIQDLNGSYKLFFHHPAESGMTVQKGSVCLNGVSLTVVDSLEDRFTVVVIPYTWDHTNLQNLQIGNFVNLEFDIVGKYIQKMMQNTRE